MTVPSPSPELIRTLPKVVLHDHLDGGLRPATVAELADQYGYDGLPTLEPGDLGAWFREGAARGDLVAYLSGFDHTCAVVQTPEAMQRIAREFVEDLAHDGVVHAEVRFAPARHTLAGMSLDDVLEAAIDGFAAGAQATGTTIGTLVTMMRSSPDNDAIAELAVRWRDRTQGQPGAVVGLDLAGPEYAHPADAHLGGFTIAHHAGLPITVHAGEADGLDSMRRALHPCGADRIGHGVRIVDDIAEDGTLGHLAAYVRDRGVPLELCPTSNVHTGAVRSFQDHPLPRLHELGFHVTLNPDDRLMSGISATSEMADAVQQWGWGLDELEAMAIAAAEVAFLPLPERRRLVADVLRPRFAAARKEAP